MYTFALCKKKNAENKKNYHIKNLTFIYYDYNFVIITFYLKKGDEIGRSTAIDYRENEGTKQAFKKR